MFKLFLLPGTPSLHPFLGAPRRQLAKVGKLAQPFLWRFGWHPSRSAGHPFGWRSYGVAHASPRADPKSLLANPTLLTGPSVVAGHIAGIWPPAAVGAVGRPTATPSAPSGHGQQLAAAEDAEGLAAELQGPELPGSRIFPHGVPPLLGGNGPMPPLKSKMHEIRNSCVCQVLLNTFDAAFVAPERPACHLCLRSAPSCCLAPYRPAPYPPQRQPGTNQGRISVHSRRT